MTDKEKLFETLGELLFAVAKADGVIQPEEKFALERFFEEHNYSSEVTWSFNYEQNKGHSVEEAYTKAIDFCKHFGPAPEYEEFIKAMKVIAKASDGIDQSEKKIINNFSNDLMTKFRKDLEIEDQ